MNEYLILSIICLITGPIAFQVRMYKYQKALQQTQLPATKGTIVSLKIETERHESEDENGHRDIDYTYKPLITYSYEVNNRSYQNTRYSTLSDPLFHNQTDANNFLKRYEVGEEISVFYDPNKPGTSFLSTAINEKSINLTTWIILFTSVIFSLVFLLIAVGIL